MRIKTLITASAIALIGFAGSASAGSVSDQFDITLNVAAACVIETPAADIVMNHDHSTGSIYDGRGSTYFDVICNKDLPYAIEVDNDAGGQFKLTDNSNGEQVQAQMSITYVNDGLNLPYVAGSAANGEAYARFGIGDTQRYTFDVYYSGYVPTVGTYLVTKTATVSW